jgi:hypothetical protein
MRKNISIEKIKNNEKLKKSMYYTRFIKFVEKHPSSFEILINHQGNLKSLYSLFLENNILNSGNPYSISTLSNLYTFVKEIKGLNS